MKRLGVFLLSLYMSLPAAAFLEIASPPDKLVSHDEVVVLKGRGAGLAGLKVNDVPINFASDGTFTCGLVLNPGKNFVEVRAYSSDEQKAVKQIRLLKLAAFPDLVQLYDGKAHWAKDQVIYLATTGAIEGLPDGNFYPAQPITRGEFASWVVRVNNLPIKPVTEDVYFDVPKEHWRAAYVKAAVDAGVMQALEPSFFGLDETMSRRDVARLSVLAEGLKKDKQTKKVFVDVEEGEEGSEDIFLAGMEGLVRGVFEESPVFDPDRALTRAEAAVLLARFKKSVSEIRRLFNFQEGFSAADYCRIDQAPQIYEFSVEPAEVKINKTATVRLRAKLGARTKLYPIAKVRVDLSSIGGATDAEMFDDGTNGDEQKGDLIYSLNLSITPEMLGNKLLTVIGVDELGWEGKKQVSLFIAE